MDVFLSEGLVHNRASSLCCVTLRVVIKTQRHVSFTGIL